MKYRSEIDGLRALAIIPVILFHTGLGLFGGGYVGVDIFFVISGYLITSIILSEIEGGTFSIVNFYERRARRILPALYFMMALCIPFAYVWMEPNDMQNFSESLIAVPMFASNLLFWRDQLGYSPAVAQLKPLLHTWSLAVEEQYYLLFPLMIILVWRLGRKYLVGLLVALAGLSLFLAQWGAYNKPVANFLLLPTRGWEFAIGSLIALYLSQQRRLELGEKAQEVLSILGLILIMFSIAVFNKNTPFPSLYTLIPTCGAALIILFGTSKTVSGSLLGSKVFVGIGLISYSAYLWHQPIFAFTRHLLFAAEPSTGLLLAISPLALVIAYFSWQVVEKPFRSKEKINRKKVFLLAGAFSLFFITIGTVGHINKGFIDRYSPKEQELLLSTSQLNVNRIMNLHGLEKCFLLQGTWPDLYDEKCLNPNSGKQRVVLFGDSHAAHLSTGIRSHFGRSEYRVDQWTMPGCSTFFLRDDLNVGPCYEMYDAFIQKVIPTLTTSDIIIISANWSFATTVISDAELIFSLDNSFSRLKNNTKAKIIVVGASPAYPKAPQSIAVRRKIITQEEIYLQVEDYLGPLNDLLEQVTNSLAIEFISPNRILCEKDNVKMCLVKKDGIFLYLDHGHLSEYGSGYLASEMWNQFEKNKKATVRSQ